MEVKIEQNLEIATYNDHMLFDNESFDILDTGMASGMVVPKCQEEEEDLIVEQPSSDSPIGRYEEIGSGWAAERPLNAGRLRMAKLFRTRDGLQRTATFPADTSIPDQDFIDETSRAVSSVDFGSTTGDEEEEEEQKTYYQPVEMEDDVQPSTSHEPPRPRGSRPLQRLTLQIGKKVLRFKVVDQITPVFTDATGKFRCTMCKLTLPTHEQWQKHNRQFHSAQKSFVCVVCGIGFTNKSSLTMHHRSHSGFKSHECNICHKVFSRATNLVQHVKMHQNGRHFCEFCGRCFKTDDQLSMHLTTCMAIMNGDFLHSDKPLRYNCSYCEKMFHHKRDKYIHERVHTGEKPYQCGYCGRGFTQSQALTIHIRIHTGERPFNCTYCDKQFRDSSALRKHEFRAHMAMNPVYEGNELEAGMMEDEYSNSIWTERA